MSTHIKGGYNKHIKLADIIVQLIQISLINATMSLLLAISHEDVLSRIPQSSLRIPHNTGCGCNNSIFFLISLVTLPRR